MIRKAALDLDAIRIRMHHDREPWMFGIRTITHSDRDALLIALEERDQEIARLKRDIAIGERMHETQRKKIRELHMKVTGLTGVESAVKRSPLDSIRRDQLKRDSGLTWDDGGP